MSDGAPCEGGIRSKVKPRPAKLKTPLDQLMMSGDVSQHDHRPIGTPPPTSLRKSAHGEATGQAFSASGGDHHFGFPKISVEDCPEGSDSEGEGQGHCPAVSQRPDNRRASLSAENNNEGGLSPPTRLVTRDQDGVVFELTGGQEAASRGATGKQSPLTPTRKPILK